MSRDSLALRVNTRTVRQSTELNKTIKTIKILHYLQGLVENAVEMQKTEKRVANKHSDFT